MLNKEYNLLNKTIALCYRSKKIVKIIFGVQMAKTKPTKLLHL